MSGVVVQNMSLKPGQTLTVTGVPNPDSKHFSINIGNSTKEVALHINPRFNYLGDQKKVVYASLKDGKWENHLIDGRFPFNQSTPFKVRIAFTGTEPVITPPDYTVVNIPNRPCTKEYNNAHLPGDARIHSIEIK